MEREDLDQEVPPGPEGRAHPVCDGQNNLTPRVAVSPAAPRTSTILSGRDYGEPQAWIERYRQLWDARFDELDNVVEELKRKEKVDGRKKRE